MIIKSSAFKAGEKIPERYSQFGKNISPPLSFDDVPTQALSLALIVEDPDAPKGTVTHWILFNLDPAVRTLAENYAPTNAVQQGNNTKEKLGYMGPRPPDREHRYFFRLFALDSKLELPNGANRAQIDTALRGHVIDEAELMGRFAPPVPVKA